MKTRIIVFMAWVAGLGTSLGYSQNEAKSQARRVTIQEAVRLALAHSPEVLLAKSQSSRASHAADEIRSLNRPQVSVGTGLAYNNGFPLSIEGSAPSVFEAGATQSIFSKTNRNLIREAEEAGKAGKWGEDASRNSVAAKTALAYYALHQARKIRSLASERLEYARQQHIRAQELLNMGKTREIDVMMAEAALRSVKHALLTAQEQEKNSEAELRELTGLSENVTVETAEPMVDSPILSFQEDDTVLKKTIDAAPEVQQAATIARAKEFRIEAAKGESYPQINLVGRYALLSRVNKYDEFFDTFVRNNVVVGVSIQVPIFSGFRRNARVAESREEALEARYRLQTLQSDLKKKLRREYSDLRIAQDSVELAQIELKTAQRNLQANEALLKAGQISSNQFEETLSILRQKEMAQLEADLELFQIKISLLRMAGVAAIVF
jgi:outer membrane protein